MADLNPRKVGVVVTCVVCGRRKAPIGRAVPLEMYLCDRDCRGYYEKPHPGSLWPGESEVDFGYPVGDDGRVESGCAEVPDLPQLRGARGQADPGRSGTE